MLKRSRFLPLAAVLTLAVAGAAIAQEGEPQENDEADLAFSFSLDDDGTTFNWSFDPEVDCTDPEELHEDCTSDTVDPNEAGEFNHGSYVSFLAQNLDSGPGRGCLIAAVARSGIGMPEDSEKAEDSGTVESPCPAGLWTWLQEKNDDGDENEGGEGQGGPPDFVAELRGGGNGGGPPEGVGRP